MALRLVGLAVLLASPLAVADGVISHCPDGNGVLVLGRGVCVKLDVDKPLDFVPNPIVPQTTRCDTGADTVGTNVTWGNVTVRACGRAGYRMPDGSTMPGIRYSLTRCGPGVDPVVEAFGGMVYFCIGAVPTIGELGLPISYDLTPCPGGFDPRVTVGGASVEFCVVLLT